MVFACVALAMLFAAALQGGGPSDAGGRDQGAEPGATALVGSATAGVVVPATRLGTSLVTDHVVEVRWAKFDAAALAAALGLGIAALAWWLSRRDGAADALRPRRSPATLRAPPLPLLA